MLKGIVNGISGSLKTAVLKAGSKSAPSFAPVPKGRELLLKGQELLANSKLGATLANSKAQKFTPIVFTPAKSVDEAAEFARKKLGMFDFRVDNLDVANYVNEAVSTYNNRIGNNSPVFHRVLYTDAINPGSNSAMCVYSDGMFNNLIIPHSFSDCTNPILFDKDAVELYEMILKSEKNLSQSQISMLKRAISDPDSFKGFEQSVLSDFVNKMCGILTDTTRRYTSVLGDGNAKKFYDGQGIKIPTVAQFSKLKPEKQEKILRKMQKDGFYPSVPDSSKFRKIFHEIGHIEHSKKLGKKYYDSITPGSAAEQIEKLTNMFRQSEPLHGEIGHISQYAQTSPGEFVAETFAALVDGNRFSDNIMQVYGKYGGPIPKLIK